MADILAVDDDALIRSYLTQVLSHEGHCVVAVESGEAALTCVSEQEFDLAFIDLKMDGIGGMDVVTAIRQQWPDTIVIVLTGHPTLETVFDALKQGAYDYLFKPCRIAELRRSVEEGLEKRRYLLGQCDVMPSEDSATLQRGV